MAAPNRKRKSSKNRKTKTFLEFNEKVRSEYLRGFQKRKNERRKIAREKNDKRIIEERKALIRQFRDHQRNKRTQESDIIPEIKHLVNPEVYNLPEHTVTIADFGEIDFVGNTGIRLGKNTNQDCKSEVESIGNGDHSNTGTAENVSTKSLQHKLAACSNKLSSQKLKSKKANKKQHLKAKLKKTKKGKKGQKGKNNR